MPDFGFVGACYQAQSITQDDQELINWYPEIDTAKADGERGVVALYPTPGFVPVTLFQASVPIRGMRAASDGNLYVVAGNAVFVVNSTFTGLVIGILLTTNGPVSLTDNGSSLYLVDGNNRYAYNFSTLVFAAVTDGAFLGGSRVDVVDNFIVYSQQNSQLWAATSLGVTTTPALSFGRKDSAPDDIVSIIVNKREIFILGQRTSEVWIDAGLFPFPFQKLPGTNMQHGCVAAQSPALLGESFAFLGQDDRGEGNVYFMDGYSPRVISTPALNAEFATYSTLADAIGMSYQENSHEFYILTFPTADKTWCYDITTGLWHRRATRDNFNVYHSDHMISNAFYAGENLFGDKQNGYMYRSSTTTFQDYPERTIPRVRRCRHLTADLNEVYHHDFQIQFQPGVGLQSGQGVDPQAMLKWSDDGGFTWSQEYWTSIGRAGQYKARARWQMLGKSRDRIYEVMVTDPVFPVIVSANLRSSAGQN